MGNQEFELTAYCGLYCGDCINYRSRAGDLARDLMSELQNVEYEKYTKVKNIPIPEFEHYGEFKKVLAEIVRLQCNQPCRVGGGCPAFICGIVACCQDKGFDGCWECAEFEACGEFEFLEKFHGDGPEKNLKKIKELGPDAWSGHRHKFFKW